MEMRYLLTKYGILWFYGTTHDVQDLEDAEVSHVQHLDFDFDGIWAFCEECKIRVYYEPYSNVIQEPEIMNFMRLVEENDLLMDSREFNFHGITKQ